MMPWSNFVGSACGCNTAFLAEIHTLLGESTNTIATLIVERDELKRKFSDRAPDNVCITAPPGTVITVKLPEIGTSGLK